MRRFPLATLALAAVALVSYAAPVLAQGTDPVSVLQQYYEARSRADLAGAMSLVAPDATYTTGPCAPVCVGAADIQQREVGPAMANGGQYTAVNVNVSGDTVRLQLEVRNKITREIGIDRFLNDISAEVRDGKIVAYKAASIPGDPQTATYLTYTRSQAPGQPAPAQNVAQPAAASPMVIVLLGLALVIVAGVMVGAVLRWRKSPRRPMSQAR